MREGREPCVRMNEERKRLQYVCSEPVAIPREYSEILDHVLEETMGEGGQRTRARQSGRQRVRGSRR
jgi:hypothetical protein